MSTYEPTSQTSTRPSGAQSSRLIKPAKPKLKHLLLLQRMIEDRLGVTTSSSLGNSHTIGFFYREPMKHADFRDWTHLHLGRGATTSNLVFDFYQWGWVNVMKKPPENKPGEGSMGSAGIFSWYDQPYVLTKPAVEYWNTTGKALLEKMQTKLTEERATVERLVIIGPKSGHQSDRHACALVRVIRETESRLYVELVEHTAKDVYDFYLIQGRSPHHYVDRNQVWRDGVTEAQYRKIVEIENVIVAEKRALRSERDRAIQEIRDRFKERELQQSAEHADLLGDV